jgi:hypothetical protein
MLKLFDNLSKLRHLPEYKLYEQSRELGKIMRRTGRGPWALIFPRPSEEELKARRAEAVRQSRIWNRLGKIVPFFRPRDY